MKEELQQKLISLYPEFLELKEESMTSYQAYGIECGDGWYDLLNNTFKLIKKHIDNPRYVKERFWYIKWAYNKTIWNLLIFPICNVLFPYKIYEKISKYLCMSIKYVKPGKNTLNIKVIQVKEKFAGLRIYLDFTDDYVDGIIAMAESMSHHICENCGTTSDVTTNNDGWMRTLCNKCRIKK